MKLVLSMWSFHRSDILIIVFQIYFSADIFFPWAIYYLYVLQAISDAPCSSSWFDNIDFDYDEFRAERDESPDPLTHSTPTESPDLSP